MKRTRLECNTRLAAKTGIGHGKKRLTYRPAAASKEEKQGRALVSRRSGGWCELRQTGCGGPATDWQHRKNRSQGGTWDASNGLAVCRSCHQLVHAFPAFAMSYGWTVRSTDDPRAVPVLLFDGLVLLDDDGQRLDPPHTAGCAVWTTDDHCDCTEDS